MTPTTPAAPTLDPTVTAIERVLDLAASPERVWRALTDSAEVASWFPQRASLPSEVGGVGWMEWDGHPRHLLRLEALEPMRRVAWRWASQDEPDFDASASLVEWELEPADEGGGTRLRLRETGFETNAARFGNVEGWFEELAELRDLLATEPWQHPIRRTLQLQAARGRVWRAFFDPAEMSAWWGLRSPVRLEVGWEGWFDFPVHGRHAVRIEVVEPPEYLSWRWSADERDVPLAEVRQPLVTEWLFVERPDGGTELRLLESGFTGPLKHADNARGWAEILPALEALVDSRSDKAGRTGVR
jgi:uncharacterized protein YndB with AHSA1/START domain